MMPAASLSADDMSGSPASYILAMESAPKPQAMTTAPSASETAASAGTWSITLTLPMSTSSARIIMRKL